MELVKRKIEEYARARSEVERPLLRQLWRATHERTNAPHMMVGHVEGSFLRLLVRLVQPKRLLEIGTFTGYSALAMAEALPPGAKLIACDVDPQPTSIALEFWRKVPYGRKIELHLAPAIKTLKDLRGPFDMVFIDADKPSYPLYWDACIPKVRRGGLIVIDNVLRDGRVLNKTNEQGRIMDRFNKKVAKDRRVEAVMLTVRDGITLAWKK